MTSPESRPLANEIRSRIRSEALRRMQLLSDTDLAQTLDLLPLGVEILRQRERWSLEEAIRVAEQLGIKVRVEIVSDDGNG